jgi:hypothetical protein
MNYGACKRNRFHFLFCCYVYLLVTLLIFMVREYYYHIFLICYSFTILSVFFLKLIYRNHFSTDLNPGSKVSLTQGDSKKPDNAPTVS